MATSFNKTEMDRQLLKVSDMLVAHLFGDTDTLPDDTNIYRVYIAADGKINVMCLGDGFVDSVCDGEYYDVNALPNWVKERIAILMLCPMNPPMPTIHGVGRRIAENIFWVFAPSTVRDSLTKQEKEDEQEK